MAEWVAEWPEYCEKEMDVRERFMDARFMNVKSFHRDGMETLQDEFEDIGLTFYATSSDAKESIRHGGHMVNDALSYNTEQPLSSLNHPHLYVSSECRNIIFALSTWTGKDGQKGATKDPVDVVRYYFLKKLGYVDPDMKRFVRGGGCY